MVKVQIAGICQQKEYPESVTPWYILKDLGVEGLEEMVVVKVNGKLHDLKAPLKGDNQFTIEIVHNDSQEALSVLRHSTSHVMAGAIKRIYPDAKLAIGPPIEDGFYYDIETAAKISIEDLPKIEEEMQKIIDQNFPFERQEIKKQEAYEIFNQKQEKYKLELLDSIIQDVVSIYKDGDFTDLCEGPHIVSTGQIKAFKLLSVAGAYWRGDENNPMLVRIYGTAFFRKKDLEDYLNRLEEVKKRDHRKLGKQLELFSIHEEAGAGLVHWHPKGTTIINIIQDYWKKIHAQNGYIFVITPHIVSEQIYKISAHLEKYADLMYAPIDIEGRRFRLKPMNCPGHILIYKSTLHSYKELPIRMAEFGTVYRFEKKGVLHGLLRVRGFTQDDAHIFVTAEQVEEEITNLIKLSFKILRKFGFEQFEVCLATRPDVCIGEEEEWKKAEESLETALKKTEIDYKIDHKGGAFYGPKIDIKLKDCLGRLWQCTTIQFDFNLPRRFDITYIDKDGKQRMPYMIHRAIIGSIERFMGILIEHYAGDFPLWLAPVQARVLPITDDDIGYATEIFGKISSFNIRAELDTTSSRISHKIREAILKKIPYMLIVGEKERASKTVSVRSRKEGDLGSMDIMGFKQMIEERISKEGY